MTDTPQTPDEPQNEQTEDASNFNERLATTKPSEQQASVASSVEILRQTHEALREVLESSKDFIEKLSAREIKAQEAAGERDLRDDEGEPWVRALSGVIDNTRAPHQGGVDAVDRDGAFWEQVLESEGMQIRPGSPKQNMPKGTNQDEVIAYMTRKAGLGTVFDVPLYHSGIWLRLKAPSLVEITNLQYQLSQLKVSLGNHTKGMAFSNTSQTLTSTAIDFVLQYVVDANVHFKTPSDLKEKILMLDIPLLLWGHAATMYPKGFPYAHPCVAGPEKCTHITRETLNINRLFWTDRNSLTNAQLKIMARKFSSKLTDDEQAQYRSDRIRGNDRVVWFDDTGLSLSVPTLQEYEDAGREWIDNIIEMSQGAFNEPPHGTNRNRFINRLAEATTARQLGHWVSAVHLRDEDDDEDVEPVVLTDRDVINETLSHIFSSGDDNTKRFLEMVPTFMDDSTVSLIAIPSFNCPVCSTSIGDGPNERFQRLIPIDALTTFFTLASRKLK